MLEGKINGYYKSWTKIRNNIAWEKYDLIHIEFTKYSFLIEDAHKKRIPVFVRMHNIEADYYYNMYKNKKNIKNYLRYWIYKKSEYKSVNIADKIICLTQHDLERAQKLYMLDSDIFCINPVCITDKGENLVNNSKIILMTGSLWYGPNVEGIKWFIKNVWPIVMNLIKK